MKYFVYPFIFLFSLNAFAQEVSEPEKLPLVPYSPGVEGVSIKGQIRIDSLFKKGIKVVLADKAFKVIQFDVVYDCHSRFLTDFNVKRYIGDRVPAEDEYMRRPVLAGDVMDIVNTVIENNGFRYCMKEFSFFVLK